MQRCGLYVCSCKAVLGCIAVIKHQSVRRGDKRERGFDNKYGNVFAFVQCFKSWFGLCKVKW